MSPQATYRIELLDEAGNPTIATGQWSQIDADEDDPNKWRPNGAQVDLVPPVVTIKSFTSSNTANPKRATTTDTVTLTFQAVDLADGTVVTFIVWNDTQAITQTLHPTLATQRACVNRQCEYSWVLQSGEITTNGRVAFRVQAVDRAGNKAALISSDSVLDPGKCSRLGACAIIADIKAPLIKTSLSSDQANQALATFGDLVTLHIEASEALQYGSLEVDVVQVSDNDGEAQSNVIGTMHVRTRAIDGDVLDNYDPTTLWTATYRINASIWDSAWDGSFTFDARWVDLTGVTGNVLRVNICTDSSQVTVDTVAPMILGVGIWSSNALPYWARLDDDIDVEFEADEPLLPASVRVQVLQGHDTPLCQRERLADVTSSGNTWEGKYRVTSGDIGCTMQAPTFDIQFTDLAGNVGTTVRTVETRGVDIDLVTPRLTAVSIASNNVDHSRVRAGQKITLVFTGSEELSSRRCRTYWPPGPEAHGSGTVNQYGAWGVSYCRHAVDVEASMARLVHVPPTVQQRQDL